MFNDVLAPESESAETAGVYTGGDYAGEPALIHNHYGEGETWYFGGAFSLEAAALFLKRLGVAEPYGDMVELPACCEAAVRRKDSSRYLFVLNYTAGETSIELKTPMMNLITRQEEAGVITVEKYGVRVYRMA